MNIYTYSQFEKVTIKVRKKWWHFWLPKEVSQWNRRYWTMKGTEEQVKFFGEVMTGENSGIANLGSELGISLWGPRLEIRNDMQSYIKTDQSYA